MGGIGGTAPLPFQCCGCGEVAAAWHCGGMTSRRRLGRRENAALLVYLPARSDVFLLVIPPGHTMRSHCASASPSAQSATHRPRRHAATTCCDDATCAKNKRTNTPTVRVPGLWFVRAVYLVYAFGSAANVAVYCHTRTHSTHTTHAIRTKRLAREGTSTDIRPNVRHGARWGVPTRTASVCRG